MTFDFLRFWNKRWEDERMEWGNVYFQTNLLMMHVQMVMKNHLALKIYQGRLIIWSQTHLSIPKVIGDGTNSYGLCSEVDSELVDSLLANCQ